MEYLTQAIVLSKSDVREYDRLFSVYTKHLGKAKILAKGVRRPQSKMAGHLEPFGLLAVKIVDGRGVNKLSNVETLRRYQNIIKDLATIRLAGGCLGLVDQLVKEGSCDLGVLQLLSQILEVLDQPAKSLAEKKFLVDVFQLKLVSHLGYHPEFHFCVNCKRRVLPVGNYFDAARGGLVCINCSQSANISEDEIKILRLILENNLDYFTDKKINQALARGAGEIINRFIQVIREN